MSGSTGRLQAIEAVTTYHPKSEHLSLTKTSATEFFGVNACHGPVAVPNPDPPEVQLRIGVRGEREADVERFTREIAPLVLNGPPSATGYGGARPRPQAA